MYIFLRNELRAALLMVFALTAIAVIGTAKNVSAQNPQFYGGAGITIFEDIDFGGRTQTFRNDVPDLVQLGWNDMMSSFRVGPGEQWELCEDINFGGRCVVVSGSERDMRVNGWNDMVSSFRRVTGNRPPTYPGGSYIVLYNQANYRGNTTTYSAADSSINDNARSVVVNSGTWELCDGRNFTGRCITVTNSVSNLATYNIGRIIRSIRPTGYVPPGPGPFPGRTSLVLFDQTNYRGAQTAYNDVQTNISDNARSVTVNRGTWQLCDGVNFTGRCITVTESISDLRGYNIGRIIRSLRPSGFVPPGPGPYPGSDAYLVLYNEANYRGEETGYNNVQTDIRDDARSVLVRRGTWQLCDGVNFSGRCVTVTQNVPDLRTYGLDHTIRSIRPMGIVPPNFPGVPNANWNLVLYDRTDFRGGSRTYRRSEANISTQTRSARVSGGVWEVCSGANFTGQCQTLTINVPDFRIYRIGDVIRSVRPQYPQ